MSIITTPNPPYYAVIFTVFMNKDLCGYSDMVKTVRKAANEQDGFIGMEAVENEMEISVSY